MTKKFNQCSTTKNQLKIELLCVPLQVQECTGDMALCTMHRLNNISEFGLFVDAQLHVPCVILVAQWLLTFEAQLHF